MKQIVQTQALQPIGAYSQAIKTGSLVFLSGQIALDPKTMEIVGGGAKAQIRQVFENIRAIVEAAGGDLQQIVKMTVFMQDLADFPALNEVMKEYFQEPYPARSALQVTALPKQALVEIEAILALGE